MSAVLALALVLGAGAVFATAAPEDEADQTAPTVFSGDVMQGSDGTVYVFTPEGKPVSMTQEEYRVLFTDPVEVEWWTAEEYAQWLEQEKKDLQDSLGQRAWTSSDGWFTWTQEKIDETIEMYEQVLEDIRNGLLVSKTVDGRTDAGLMEGGKQTPYSSEDGMVLYAFDGDAAYTGTSLDEDAMAAALEMLAEQREQLEARLAEQERAASSLAEEKRQIEQQLTQIAQQEEQLLAQTQAAEEAREQAE